MQIFVVDPRDVNGLTGPCETCCCQHASGRPGEINKWTINYAPWSVQILGHGLVANPRIEVTDVKVTTPVITNEHYNVSTNYGVAAVVDVAAQATLPVGVTAEYVIAGMGGPINGTAILTTVGVLTYTPNPGWSGDEIIWIKMTASNGEEIIRQVKIHVRGTGDVTSDAVDFSGAAVTVISACVNSALHQTYLNVVISDHAVPADIYRVTIKQATTDCDGNEYYHVSCYDLVISKCG